jgi:hypothetical protein
LQLVEVERRLDFRQLQARRLLLLDLLHVQMEPLAGCLSIFYRNASTTGARAMIAAVISTGAIAAMKIVYPAALASRLSTQFDPVSAIYRLTSALLSR